MIKIMIVPVYHAHLEQSPGDLNVWQVRIRYCNSFWQRRALRTAIGREPLEPAPCCRRPRLCVNWISIQSGCTQSRQLRWRSLLERRQLLPDGTRWLQLINAGQQTFVRIWLSQRSGASSETDSFDALPGGRPLSGASEPRAPPTPSPLSVKQRTIEVCGIFADVL
jgi:hypothetical protein